MDSNTNTVIIILNFILQIIQMFDHSFLQRIKKSSCCGSSIELNDDKDKTNNKL